jgi:hypothetical protein
MHQQNIAAKHWLRTAAKAQDQRNVILHAWRTLNQQSAMLQSAPHLVVQALIHASTQAGHLGQYKFLQTPQGCELQQCRVLQHNGPKKLQLAKPSQLRCNAHSCR